MEYLWIVFTIVGVFWGVLGLAVLVDGDGVGLFPMFLGAILLFIGISQLVSLERHKAHVNHIVMVRNLHSEGWKITWADVKARKGTVDIACINFDLRKLNGKWQVVTNRASSAGGGYNIVTSDHERKLREACP